jgi:hypothetical protein
MAGKDVGDFQPAPPTARSVAQNVDTPDAAPASEESH